MHKKILIAPNKKFNKPIVERLMGLSYDVIILHTKQTGSMHINENTLRSICIGTNTDEECNNADKIIDIAKMLGVSYIYPGDSKNLQTIDFILKTKKENINYLGLDINSIQKINYLNKNLMPRESSNYRLYIYNFNNTSKCILIKNTIIGEKISICENYTGLISKDLYKKILEKIKRIKSTLIDAPYYKIDLFIDQFNNIYTKKIDYNIDKIDLYLYEISGFDIISHILKKENPEIGSLPYFIVIKTLATDSQTHEVKEISNTLIETSKENTYIFSHNEDVACCHSKIRKILENNYLDDSNLYFKILANIFAKNILSDPSCFLTDADMDYLKNEVKKYTCPNCRKYSTPQKLEENSYICDCGHHFPMPAKTRLKNLGLRDFIEIDLNYQDYNIDMLRNDLAYKEKLAVAQKYTKLSDAVICGRGKIGLNETYVAIMDSNFLMGSMGFEVGEKITKTIEKATEENLPLIIVSTSGGARMQEGIISLMQMSKICAALKKFEEKGLFYLSILTNPTTGGVLASFALLGDVNISEPNTLLGFSGKRVIEDTIRQKLPDDFQSSEKLLERGYLDMIVQRSDLKETINSLLDFHKGGKNGYYPLANCPKF